MGFLSVRFRGFRNLRDQEVALEAPEVFLVGENGQGKTNFVESVYLLCFGGSFRTRQDSRMIHTGDPWAVVGGRYLPESGVAREISVRLEENGRKEIRVDSKSVQDRLELIENAPCIIFSHQDLAFVNGPPEMGRRFFNQTLSLFDPLFIALLRSYRRLLRARNLLLKDANLSLLPSFSRNLAETGLRIQQRREGIVGEFNRTFGPLFAAISGLPESTTIQYRASWRKAANSEDVLRALERTQERDLSMQTTTTGPHRDRFVLMQQGREFAPLASTGQIRLCSLILRVAQASFYQAKTGKRPLLLLDDVLLELDATRRERFLKALPACEQAFFTFLPDEQYLTYRRDNTLMYKVHGGELQRETSF
jgi:DNA replication and repair protein RecF